MKAQTYKTVKTYLDLEGSLGTFVYPAYKGTYEDCMQQIRADGLQTPTFAQVIDLAYDTVIRDPKNKYSKKIKQIMKDYWVKSNTGILYLTDGKIFVQDGPLRNYRGEPCMETSELEAKLQAGDPSVRFVEQGFKTGEQTAFKLAQNQLIIALAGEQGAEKLAEIASVYKNNPIVLTEDLDFMKAFEPIRGKSKAVFLGLGFDKDGKRINVNGTQDKDHYEGKSGNCYFGMIKPHNYVWQK